MATAGSSLHYCHKIPDVFEQLSPYSIKMYIGITICVVLILLMQLVNGAQFLNITFLLALFGAAAVSCATVIVPLVSIYASL